MSQTHHKVHECYWCPNSIRNSYLNLDMGPHITDMRWGLTISPVKPLTSSSKHDQTIHKTLSVNSWRTYKAHRTNNSSIHNPHWGTRMYNPSLRTITKMVLLVTLTAVPSQLWYHLYSFTDPLMHLLTHLSTYTINESITNSL